MHLNRGRIHNKWNLQRSDAFVIYCPKNVPSLERFEYLLIVKFLQTDEKIKILSWPAGSEEFRETRQLGQCVWWRFVILTQITTFWLTRSLILCTFLTALNHLKINSVFKHFRIKVEACPEHLRGLLSIYSTVTLLQYLLLRLLPERNWREGCFTVGENCGQ